MTNAAKMLLADLIHKGMLWFLWLHLFADGFEPNTAGSRWK